MPKRRRSIRKIALLLLALAGVVGLFSVTAAPRWLRVHRLRVGVPNLPPEWEGLRIAHLSDFHLGATLMKTGHLHKARAIAEAFEPDVFALTGDFYDSGRDVASEGLYTNWPGGAVVLAVMGNHDRRGPSGTLEVIKAELRQAGVTILNNDALKVCLRGRGAWIAGVDDPHTFNSDVGAALGNVPAGESVLLFLAHGPAAVLDLEPGQASVLLAGHTHGGQIRLLPSGAVPFIDPLRKLLGADGRPDGPVYRRWHRINGTILIISDGLGVSTLPIRFRTRPHLILIELVAAEKHDERACDDIDRYVTDLEPENRLLRWLT